MPTDADGQAGNLEPLDYEPLDYNETALARTRGGGFFGRLGATYDFPTIRG
jgi:hypothetical protein